MGGVHVKEMKCSKCNTRVLQPMDMATGGYPKMDKCPKCGELDTLEMLRVFVRSTG